MGKNIQQNLIEKNNCKENEKKITIINGYISFEKINFEIPTQNKMNIGKTCGFNELMHDLLFISFK